MIDAIAELLDDPYNVNRDNDNATIRAALKKLTEHELKVLHARIDSIIERRSLDYQ